MGDNYCDKQFNYHIVTDYFRDTCIDRHIFYDDFMRLYEHVFYNHTELIENFTEINTETYKKIYGFWQAFTLVPFCFFALS